MKKEIKESKIIPKPHEKCYMNEDTDVPFKKLIFVLK